MFVESLAQVIQTPWLHMNPENGGQVLLGFTLFPFSPSPI